MSDLRSLPLLGSFTICLLLDQDLCCSLLGINNDNFCRPHSTRHLQPLFLSEPVTAYICNDTETVTGAASKQSIVFSLLKRWKEFKTKCNSERHPLQVGLIPTNSSPSYSQCMSSLSLSLCVYLSNLSSSPSSLKNLSLF